MASAPRKLLEESASKIGGEVTEVLAQRYGLADGVASTLGSYVSRTIELLILAGGGAEVATEKVVAPILESQIKLLFLTQPEAAACSTALYDLFIADGASKLKLARGGVAGAAAYGAFMVYDALKVYGECYIPLKAQLDMRAAERNAFASFMRASGKNACAMPPRFTR